MRIKPKQYAEVLFETVSQVKETDLKKTLNNFVQLLKNHNQVSQIDKIMYFFDQIWDNKKNVVKTQIISAHKIDEQTNKLLKDYIKKSVDGEIDFSTKIDENLKGGFILRYGDKSIDHSLQNRLRQLKAKLIK